MMLVVRKRLLAIGNNEYDGRRRRDYTCRMADAQDETVDSTFRADNADETGGTASSFDMPDKEHHREHHG